MSLSVTDLPGAMDDDLDTQGQEPSPEEPVGEENPQETPETPETPDAAPEGEAGESGEPCPTCQGPDKERIILELAKLWTGEDFSTKYKNDREFLQGLVSASKLVGRRNAEAQVLQQLQAKYGEDGLQALLEGRLDALLEKQAPQKKEEPEEPEWDFNEADFTPWLRRDADGRWTFDPNTPQEVIQKGLQFAAHRERLLNEFAKRPKQFLKTLLQDTIAEAARQVVYETLHQTQRASSFAQWVEQHKEMLFQGDSTELTPFGNYVLQLADWLQTRMGTQNREEAIQTAGEMAKLLVSMQQNQTKTPPPSALHTPQQRGKAQKMTIEDVIESWVNNPKISPNECTLERAYRIVQGSK